MSDINHVVIQGRFTKDPQWFPANEDGSESTSDRCWAVIAVNPPTKHPKAKTSFIVVNAFGGRARVMAKYGKKGKVWGVVGSIKTDRKELPEGGYKNYTEVSVAQNIMGPDAKGVTGEPAAVAAPAAAPSPDYEKAAQALADANFSAAEVAALIAKKRESEQSGDAPF